MCGHIFKFCSMDEPYFCLKRSINEPHFYPLSGVSFGPSSSIMRLTNQPVMQNYPSFRLTSHIFTLISCLFCSKAWGRGDTYHSIQRPHTKAAWRVCIRKAACFKNTRLPSHIYRFSALDDCASFFAPHSINRPQSIEALATNFSHPLEYRATFDRLSSHKIPGKLLVSFCISLLKLKTICYIKNKQNRSCLLFS